MIGFDCDWMRLPRLTPSLTTKFSWFDSPHHGLPRGAEANITTRRWIESAVGVEHDLCSTAPLGSCIRFRCRVGLEIA